MLVLPSNHKSPALGLPGAVLEILYSFAYLLTSAIEPETVFIFVALETAELIFVALLWTLFTLDILFPTALTFEIAPATVLILVALVTTELMFVALLTAALILEALETAALMLVELFSVSYTHLTLPTSG